MISDTIRDYILSFDPKADIKDIIGSSDNIIKWLEDMDRCTAIDLTNELMEEFTGAAEHFKLSYSNIDIMVSPAYIKIVCK